MSPIESEPAAAMADPAGADAPEPQATRERRAGNPFRPCPQAATGALLALVSRLPGTTGGRPARVRSEAPQIVGRF